MSKLPVSGGVDRPRTCALFRDQTRKACFRSRAQDVRHDFLDLKEVLHFLRGFSIRDDWFVFCVTLANFLNPKPDSLAEWKS